MTATYFAVVWGFSAGFGQVSYHYIIPHYFGTMCIAKLNSMFVTATILGSAIGPIAYGVAIEKVGSWQTILWWTVPFAVISMISLLLIKKPVLDCVQESEY